MTMPFDSARHARRSVATPIRRSLRSFVLGSAALCFAASAGLPPGSATGGLGTAFAQSTSGHGRGGAGGYRGGAGSGGSGMHGSGEHGSTAGEDSQGGTHESSGGPGEASSDGEHGSTSGEAGHGGTHGSGAGESSGGTRESGGASVSHGRRGGSAGEAAGEEGASEGRRGRGGGGGGSAGKAEGGGSGGRPVWASEGIPEVELGRLNVARAPAGVLNHALGEVTSNWPNTSRAVITLNNGEQMTVAELYSRPAGEFARIVQNNYRAIVRIDSPLENLGLLKDLVSNQKTALAGVTPASQTDLAAIFLGSASDKTMPITADTVTALYAILGLPGLSAEQTATLANEADAVRSGINTGHGE